MILERVYGAYTLAEFLIPYANGDITSYFMEQSQVLESAFEENGTRIKVRCHRADKNKYNQYLI